MPLVGFEPTISAGERQQNYALERAATGIQLHHMFLAVILVFVSDLNSLFSVFRRYFKSFTF